MENDLTFKMIKARIWHSYQTDLDDSLNQCEAHMRVLYERYDKNRFQNVQTLEADIRDFLCELQEEVNSFVGLHIDVHKLFDMGEENND